MNIAPQYFEILSQIYDPEIPVLSIIDLGVVRKVIFENDILHIDITPTYSGCPAMDTISADIEKAFEKHQIKTKIKLILSPAWTTDWITEKGKNNLQKYGIAPPLTEEADKAVLLKQQKLVQCPQCAAQNTVLISQFGSTACKALFKCLDCLEPFDYFKCLK
ncbi:1,2-phenylacetyl-CoA epoxidase subunit PaaD [Flavobacterium branchiophilum]|uniref:Phenylacetic acid degradation protein PaaD n=1 Tax=Flavobacterium branchiophilum (strain FL-15) TaxID=1034807 RepID=G2Z116_FLABF|nr:1,2-phenylacetyl-CoA epoxidase subunit PaaD [Flavobacterium branchiophilum]CCB69572.1 Phenylacetic acid degradation protein PaaD [Flavobacterium branchiophilum FL-15]